MTVSKALSSYPFFFILGRPRSGTTLLRTLFDAHPEVNIPLESPLIKELGSKYSSIHTWNEKLLDDFYHDLIRQRKFTYWEMDTETLQKEIMKCTGEYAFTDLIRLVYLHFPSYFEKSEIRILGDKNPTYSTYPEKIYRLFPDALYIHLTRDYRDNILSIMKVDFEAPYVPLIAYRWRNATAKIEVLKKNHPDQFYTIRYEDLVADPACELEKICKFLHIAFDPSILEFYKVKDKLVKKYPVAELEKIHKSLFNPISNVNVDGWKKKMKKLHVKQADLIAGKYAEISGYPRQYTHFGLWVYLSVVPGIIYGWISHTGRVIIDLLPMKIRIGIQNKGSILARTYWLFYKIFKSRN